MLKRDGWRAVQEAQSADSNPSDEDWARLSARLAKEVTLNSRIRSLCQSEKGAVLALD